MNCSGIVSNSDEGEEESVAITKANVPRESASDNSFHVNTGLVKCVVELRMIFLTVTSKRLLEFKFEVENEVYLQGWE
ncbi:unnamed protein product [Sphenostylis stenocarpa]|uniref:Uncharacterized protein n=1 Tax=Sphenostylis stenocarpa TaxID=92480 RepID=A0AA86V200_9FABA|nr:unnamed protein product [Sphenostylis stenocarpa]